MGAPSPAAGLMRASGSYSHYPTDSGDYSSQVHSRGWHESLAAGRASQVRTQLQPGSESALKATCIGLLGCQLDCAMVHTTDR